MTNKERLQQNNLELEECIALAGTGGGGGGSGAGIIDVTELPTENIDENAVYRISGAGGAEVWVVDAVNKMTFADVMAKMGANVHVPIYVVETLPETMEKVDAATAMPLYVVNSTGIAYISYDGTPSDVTTAGNGMFGYPDKGWVESIDDIEPSADNRGVYSVRVEASVELYTYSEGNWTKYMGQDVFYDMIAEYEEEIDSLNIRLAPVNFEDYAILDESGTSITGLNLSNADKMDKVKSIEIPNTIQTIGDSALAGCTNLKYVIFEEGSTLNKIGEQAFMWCGSIENLAIPVTVTNIAAEVFYGCLSLTSITYNGTKEQWKAITFGVDWYGDQNTPNFIITCTDGTIAKNGTET